MSAYKNIKMAILLSAATAVLFGCSKSTLTAPEKLGTFDVNMYPLNKLVCDPMGGGGPLNPGKGLKASLYYTRPDQPHYSKLSDYFANGIKSPQAMFFSQINVPTRKFALGFPTETGGIVRDDAGNNLIEYFAIRFSTVLKLTQNDSNGVYEFALLSDDGTTMKTTVQGQDTILVSNDGDHPTKMGCGIQTLNMTQDSEYLVDFEYYQGPRYHISFIPLWRKKSASNPVETECGKSGNSRYFDFENNSAPQQAYKDILARGWKPIAPENYNLPISAIFNPCVTGVAPHITGFIAEDLFFGRVRVAWNTDIPASSQVRYLDVSSGVEMLSNSDNMLRTQHEIILDGLTVGQSYTFQGVSISDDYGKSISDPVTLQLRGGAQ